jgi:hypothetical protein
MMNLRPFYHVLVQEITNTSLTYTQQKQMIILRYTLFHYIDGHIQYQANDVSGHVYQRKRKRRSY